MFQCSGPDMFVLKRLPIHHRHHHDARKGDKVPFTASQKYPHNGNNHKYTFSQQTLPGSACGGWMARQKPYDLSAGICFGVSWLMC